MRSNCIDNYIFTFSIWVDGIHICEPFPDREHCYVIETPTVSCVRWLMVYICDRHYYFDNMSSIMVINTLLPLLTHLDMSSKTGAKMSTIWLITKHE